MRLSNALLNVRALALLACLTLCPLASVAVAQDNANSGAATQSTQQTNRASTTQTTRTTTTATNTAAPSQPAQTTTVSQTRNATGIDPLWLIIGAVALLAILLIVILSSRGRSRSSGERVETVRETTIRKD
jgi:beta-lactamase regulating signal transducer with metallopeptidase domain